MTWPTTSTNTSLATSKATQPATSVPSVFNYQEYRTYLNDFYLAKKSHDPRYSFAIFSKAAGLSSPNYLKLVKDGQRNLTLRNIRKFAKGLSLQGLEGEYFEYLVSYNQSTSVEDRIFYHGKLSAIRDRRTSGRKSSDIDRNVFSHFATFMIREMIDLESFQDDPAWIQKRLGIFLTLKEIREIINVLIKAQLLTRNQKGELIQAERIVQIARDKADPQVAKFHQELLSSCTQHLAKISFEERDMNAWSATLQASDFKPMMKEVTQALSEIVRKYARGRNEGATVVVQLNSQFMKLTK